MEISTERLAAIISCMYIKNAELVINVSGEQCYLFVDGFPQEDMPLSYEEVDCLIDSNIIELDSGCDEEEHETKVYRLTELATSKVQEAIRNKKEFLLRE